MWGEEVRINSFLPKGSLAGWGVGEPQPCLQMTPGHRFFRLVRLCLDGVARPTSTHPKCVALAPPSIRPGPFELPPGVSWLYSPHPLVSSVPPGTTPRLRVHPSAALSPSSALGSSQASCTHSVSRLFPEPSRLPSLVRIPAHPHLHSPHLMG